MSVPLNAARDNAIFMAERYGWHCFPVRFNGKRPVTSHGQDDASADPDVLRRLFRSHGMGNVGIHCRPSGIYVVDVDMNPWEGKVGKASWEALVALHGHVETYTVRTWSGGLHFYYSHAEGLLANTSGALGPDIDTRGNGYVVATPSFVRETHEGVTHEGFYEVIDDRDPVPLPQWIIDALAKPEPRAHRSIGDPAASEHVEARVRALACDLADCTSGANDLAARLCVMAGNYVGAGQISRDQVEKIMLDAVADWSWARPEDERTMQNTIRRQIDFGAQRSDRPWSEPMSQTGVYDKYDTQVPEPSPAPPLKIVKGDVPPPAPEIGRGQYRMSQRMLRSKGEDLRYSSALGWHVWDGARWRPDRDGATVRLAHDVINDSWKDVPSQEDADARKAFVSDINKVESVSGLEGMLYHLRAMFPVAAGEDPFDKAAHLFNTPSGTVDLHDGGLREHRREDLVSKMAGAEIGTQRSEVFETFLERILPDPEVRAYVQRLFGQAMLGRVTEHILPIFTGQGANGKGTLRDAVSFAFGDYATDVDPEILMEQKFGRHGTFMLELLGRRLVFCSETEKGRKFAEATMKRLVGGDPIQGNRMHKDPITFMPSHLMILLTNDLPVVSGDDAAVWRRIQVVPFDVVIPPAERDGNLSERLKQEAPAVLAWVYEGWLQYRQQGLNPPEAVKIRTDTYRNENDAVGRFLSERTVRNPHSSPRASEVYEAYVAWCREEGEAIESISDFGKSMAKHGVPKQRKSAGVSYPGILVMGTDDEPEF